MADALDAALATRARDALEVLLASCSPLSSSDGTPWSHVATRADVGCGLVISSSAVSGGGGALRYKGVCTLAAPAARVAAALADSTSRLKWDSNVASLDVVELSTPGAPYRATLLRSATRAVGPISAREFLDCCAAVGPLPPGEAARNGWTPPAGTLVSGGVGVEADGRFPPAPGFVRGINGVCGWVFEPTSDGQCRVHYVILTHLKGWLPALVVNSSLSGALVTFFSELAGALAKGAGGA